MRSNPRRLASNHCRRVMTHGLERYGPGDRPVNLSTMVSASGTTSANSWTMRSRSMAGSETPLPATCEATIRAVFQSTSLSAANVTIPFSPVRPKEGRRPDGAAEALLPGGLLAGSDYRGRPSPPLGDPAVHSLGKLLLQDPVEGFLVEGRSAGRRGGSWSGGGWFGGGWFGRGRFGRGWFGGGWFGRGWFGRGWFGRGWFGGGCPDLGRCLGRWTFLWGRHLRLAHRIGLCGGFARRRGGGRSIG